MLKLEYWVDKYKRKDGRDYCCCGVDTTNADGQLETFFRAATMNEAKMEMLDNLKTLRNEIDDLIKREEEHFFMVRFSASGYCGAFRYAVKAHNLDEAKAAWETYLKLDENVEYKFDQAIRDCCGFVSWRCNKLADFDNEELKEKAVNVYELEFENWGGRSDHLDD